MKIDNQLIESLLYEEEGVELDLKEEQYKFIKAIDDDKCELLKDVLAFANAWRRSDAFILVGVKDVKGGRSLIVGITDLLDDASIQQFINTKTNRPIIFSYQNLSFEGKKIAVIHIPIQQRPIYLKKDFGKLKSDTVYLRRGSSTAIADIDEISKMGTSPHIEVGKPELDVFFANPSTRTRLSNRQSIKSLVLEIPPKSSIPDYSSENNDSYGIGISPSTNYSYYKELAHFTKITKLVSPLFIAVGNTGSLTAQDVRIEIKMDKANGAIKIVDPRRYPDTPKRQYNPLDFHIHRGGDIFDIEISDVGNSWIIEARAEKVQPKAVQWFYSPIYLGATTNCTVNMEISVFSDELSIPKKQQLFVDVQSEQQKIDLKGIINIETERFRASPEYKKLMNRHKENLGE